MALHFRALLDVGAELLREFRESGGAADVVFAGFTKRNRFLGSHERRFLGTVYFHTLRNLRRIDEALVSAFAGLPPSQLNRAAGFPVSDQAGAIAWQITKFVPHSQRPKRTPTWVIWLDMARLTLAAMERQLAPIDVLAPELHNRWPAAEGKFTPTEDTLVRMFTRAREVGELFAADSTARAVDRACSIPAWMWGHLGYGLSPQEGLDLAKALLEQAPIALRVNTLRTNVDDAMAVLEAAELKPARARWEPNCIHLEGRVGSDGLPHFRDGWFEYQDEASQLCARFCDPKPGMRVIDACTGGGGKTLALAALMRNEGTILCHDANPSRMEPLHGRAWRGGVTLAEALDTEEADGPPLEADLVLIDAPCSGTGTLRRAPDLKWRLSRERISVLQQTQTDLLRRWSKHVKPGGTLVYATCSLFSEENAAPLMVFLSENRNFVRDREGAVAAMGEHAPKLLNRDGDLQLYPHRHGCDGFFSARLRRVS